jgi:AmiR/NasT family two-component response regulator
VEQAKGMLASRASISVAEAFTRMRSHARRNGLALTTVASSVVDGSIDARALTGA